LEFGFVRVDININDPRLSDQTITEFNIQRDAGFFPEYQFEAEASQVSPWTYVVLVFLAAAIAVGTVLYRRRRQDELLSEMSEVFEYTAELLAAGDSIREAIFNCYQNLCGTLQTRGLLRRDFETVREFEVAIRQATPGISDDALQSLDNMFEMARYSREELGASHQQSAQGALDKMITELSYKKY
jgi:Flp pilus assembly protein TadB